MQGFCALLSRFRSYFFAKQQMVRSAADNKRILSIQGIMRKRVQSDGSAGYLDK
jgi:hypothetical protein